MMYLAEGYNFAHSCAIRVVDSIEKMDSAVRPDEYKVEFAIRLSAGIAQIVEFGTEAQMHVTMKWVKPQQRIIISRNDAAANIMPYSMIVGQEQLKLALELAFIAPESEGC